MAPAQSTIRFALTVSVRAFAERALMVWSLPVSRSRSKDDAVALIQTSNPLSLSILPLSKFATFRRLKVGHLANRATKSSWSVATDVAYLNDFMNVSWYDP